MGRNGKGSMGWAGKVRKRAAIKAIFAAYVSPLLAFIFQSNSFGGWGGIGETMSGICFLVVVDSYAIALIPSLFPSPLLIPLLFYLLGD